MKPASRTVHAGRALAARSPLAPDLSTAAVHVFTDGRDTPPRAGGGYVRALADALPEAARIATISGRYYAMDRDKRWDRVA